MNVTARWPVLDLYKFLLALLLIVAHYTSEYAPLPGLFDTLTTLYIVAVPFYLTCSSFLFFQRRTRPSGAICKKSSRCTGPGPSFILRLLWQTGRCMA